MRCSLVYRSVSSVVVVVVVVVGNVVSFSVVWCSCSVVVVVAMVKL